MSNLLMDLVGRRCLIKNDEEEFLTGDPEITCHVVAADNEWIKVSFVDEEGNRISRLERLETIDSVIIYEDCLM